MALHAPVHGLVSGGGLTVDGQWRQGRTGFLLPGAVVRALLRGKVLGAIEELGLTGQLTVPPHWPEDGVRQVLVQAARPKWNIRIAKRYPHGRGVVKYLARSVRGGPIKAQRLVRFDGEQGTFRYGNRRDPEERGVPRPPLVTLAVTEFLTRWSAHVPLAGVHTVRAWGLYASTQRHKLEECRAQLPEQDAPRITPTGAENESPPDRDRPWEQCPVCQQPLVITSVLPRAGTPPRVEAWAAAA